MVEEGDAQTVFQRPRHPYTRALLKAALDLAPNEAGALAS